MGLLSRLTASLVAWIVVHTETNFPMNRSVVISVFIGLKMHQIVSEDLFSKIFRGAPAAPFAITEKQSQITLETPLLVDHI